jgi:hypothetical protein
MDATATTLFVTEQLPLVSAARAAGITTTLQLLYLGIAQLVADESPSKCFTASGRLAWLTTGPI